ncbi:hypothetical protein AB1Y20_011984 [Prymnesium parvum]|uniref:Uncharacterized protein n=1 Tax=Prymnesium parvum TaxID=97485 RepID=A0AB34IQH0_PRYPA
MLAQLINAAVPLDSSGAHLEFTVWSDCVSVQLRPGAGTSVFDTSAINWTIGTHTHAEYGTTAAGAEATLRICMSPNGELPLHSEDTASTVGEAQVHASVDRASIETAWDARRGEHRVVVPSSFPKCAYSSGCAPTHDIEVSAHGPPGSILRLVLSRNFHEWSSTSSRTGSEITGLSAVWYEDGQPSGRGVQISKNWHTQQGLNDPYQGYWWTFNSLVVLPTSGVWNGTCRVYYAGVVGGDATVSAAVVLAAASHGQLSLIGWGAFGLWEQVALGSGGEVMTYEPYGEQARLSAFCWPTTCELLAPFASRMLALPCYSVCR